MKSHKIISTSVLVFAAALLVLAFSASTARSAHADGLSIPTVFYHVATSTAETVSTSNTRVIATSTGRTWFKLSNNSANPIFCAYNNGAPAANNQGFLIAASSTYEMNQLNSPVYTGAINCIAQGASASIWVEANQ